MRGAAKVAHRLMEETAFKHRDTIVKVVDTVRGMHTRQFPPWRPCKPRRRS